jgi:hypothetical protein
MRSLRSILKVESKNIFRVTGCRGLFLVSLQGFYESPYCWAIDCKASTATCSMAAQSRSSLSAKALVGRFTGAHGAG